MATTTTHGMAAVADDSGFIDDAVAFALKNLGLCHVSLKKEQSSAIRAIYEGHDVFVCLPTGFGKHALPFVIDYKLSCARQDTARSSTVVVISPLIALMEDQLPQLH